ncbi:Wadjet anti-phage system protein JetD domain-containing protein [Inquilinus sp.]|uniref:Wadjet anti-phage system protein JetD domain-containing protein n=1 Tax=Inquilinus sp. TaxID=1932117 RepID=UPI003784F7EF
MSRRRFSDAALLLNDLLDRHESNPTAIHLLAYVDDAGFTSVRERDRFEQSLETAAQSGGIGIQRRQIDGDMEIAHVRLIDADALYRFLDRPTAHQRVRGALADARLRTDLPATAQHVFDELAEAWARGVSRFGLTPGDSAGLRTCLDLVLAIEARASDLTAISIDYRSFSRAAGADSKALDRLSGPTVTLHGRLYSARSSTTSLDVDDILASYGISRMPQPLLLSGPLAVSRTPLPDLAFYGFPPERGEAIGLSRKVDYVLTIENYTSFVRHVREINADHSGLIIYTGGFPARSHLLQIVYLAAVAAAPVFHWGDMDAGGVRIFRHIEDALRTPQLSLQPHLMNPATLRAHGIASNNQRRLAVTGASTSAIADLWVLIAETNLAFEQESMAPTRPSLS